ncbi:hypothetical protein M902_2350 [Bacteriovorax sp. BAL6_X]|uniref:hypothetical protein n=1 Tax=Bacteriovorax sp. BAL6_X TaxID=1201290 RepID=UPI0003857A16|nr:hypothetical protein [Bacteriovorax sp. BAL6_X]EPZ51922.1 hypothetical protein M902_2350 [Bacteriovorax sp. BAL6_X]
MSEYNVYVDRSKLELQISNNNIYLPYAKDGRYWNDICRSVKLTSQDGNATDEVRDLVDVSIAIFNLDKLCPREMRERWVRRINLHIGLRNAAAFRQIKDKLEWALSVLGADNINFVISDYVDQEFTSFRPNKFSRKIRNATDICLLSGGQDSLVGAAKLLDEDKNLIFVRINTNDRANLSQIQGHLGVVENGSFNFFSQTAVNPGDTPYEKESSQRLRSFHFLSIASVIAKLNNLEDIYINENGIMAVHLPLDVARSSSFSTRTAYPLFLKLFGEVVSTWLDTTINIKNKLALYTKAEVLELGYSLNIDDAIDWTVSCAHSGTIQQTVKKQRSKDYLMAPTADEYHCGYCFPCVLRRLSMWKNGKGDDDVIYATNPFKVIVDGSAKDFKFVYEASTAILGLIRFVKKFEGMSRAEIISDYPQVLECGYVLGVGSVDEIILMHERFKDDVFNYINQEASYLLFLLDDNIASQMEERMQNIGVDELMNSALNRANVELTDAFYKQAENMFDFLRLRIQVALATGQMNESEMKTLVSRVIEEIVPSNSNGVTKLTMRDSREFKEKVWGKITDQPCPPFW